MQGTEDILGHRAVIDRLWAALSRDALHHAYLFEGPSGLGKHLVARRLAMAANCEAVDADGVDPARHPCGVCPSCRAILRGIDEQQLPTAATTDNSSSYLLQQQLPPTTAATNNSS